MWIRAESHDINGVTKTFKTKYPTLSTSSHFPNYNLFIHAKSSTLWLFQGHTSGWLFTFPTKRYFSCTYIQVLKGFHPWNSEDQPKVLHNFCSDQDPSGILVMGLHCSLPCHLLHEFALLCVWGHTTALSIFHVFLALRVVWLQSWPRISIIHITLWSPTLGTPPGEDASGKSGFPCQNALSSSPSPLDTKLFAMLLFLA